MSKHVATIDNLADRFWAKVDKRGPDECWPWLGAMCGGYGMVQLDGRRRQATHASLYIETGEWPAKGLLACHRCDNPPCVNPAHLFVGSIADNNRDKVLKGRMKSERLTQEDVMQIRQQPVRPSEELAQRYGLSVFAIDAILAGRTWKHVPAQENCRG